MQIQPEPWLDKWLVPFTDCLPFLTNGSIKFCGRNKFLSRHHVFFIKVMHPTDKSQYFFSNEHWHID